MKRNSALIFIIAVLALCSCKGSIIHIGKPLNGILVSLTYIGDPSAAGEVSRAAFDEMGRVAVLLDPSRQGSDLYRLNEGAGRWPLAVSAEAYGLIRKSADISGETDGCFDVTAAPVESLWDFTKKDFVPPDWGAVAAARALTDYRNIQFQPDGKSVFLKNPGMKIGLGIVARGFAIRKAMETLSARGVRSAIVEAGGDLQVMGSKYGKRWITGLRNPRKSSIMLNIELEDMDAVSTCGDYERFIVQYNRRYHNVIDPRTGYPAEGFSSVTVISKHPALSGPYARALFVMGMKSAGAFLARHGEIDVVLVDRDLRVFASRRLKKRIMLIDNVTVKWL